ncbi:UvrD-helicase domain-containing protein [Conchiformibius kuhniae]|uniref:DNA 3'-5' helicase n=1 Tax=Conchiformibius kuhniae TaxID=211502 RepID=A0ABD8B887_9NEIS|nr:UvrD-helicase domain-containing protein [Conchiformibius kuhniae]
MFEEDFAQTPLLSGLNPEQLAAVTYPAEPLLILAGAGSGKTRVLTTRIAWLLHTAQAQPHNVLAVTFTNKAAKEMRTRLGAMVSHSLRRMWLGTFHGLCHRFLRIHHREADLPPSFQVLDSADQLALIKRLLKQAGISEEAVVPRVLQGFINAQKENGLRAADLDAPDPHTKRLIACYADYEQTCRREGTADFAELLLRAYEVLNARPELLAHYQSRFTHILVDEFQDTNALQYRWLTLLAGGGAALCAVGDDDQSIYRFRGARVGNMADLMTAFGIDAPVKLEQNYRSAGNILAAANAVIARNRKRLGKNLRTGAGAGEPIRFYSAADDAAEARFIAGEIQALRQEGLPLAHMAVLYRSNAQSRILEQTLFAERIPYRIYGGLRFYERAEIKHALAYLRLAVHRDDDHALLRIINMPPRGIGARTVEQIQQQAQSAGVSLFAAAVQLAGASAKIAAFVRLIHDLHERAQVADLAELTAYTVAASGLHDYFAKQKIPAERERTENLDELVNAARFFRPEEAAGWDGVSADTAGVAAVAAFLGHAALEAGDNQADGGQDAVQLMTVHAAKGLEFDAVFVSGLEEGRFPGEQSLGDAEAIEEERRLMYVALTRAKRRLYLSMAQQRMLHGMTRTGVPSRFVGEIPENLLHFLSPKPARRGAGHFDRFGAAQTAAAGGGFYAGLRVRHTKFGKGVVLAAREAGGSVRVKVNFGSAGIKELDTAFARLEMED